LEKIVDRTSGEILGTLRETSIHAGWLDRVIFELTGFTYKPWTCGKTLQGAIVTGPERMALGALIDAVIRNPTNPRKDRNGHQELLHDRVIR
jgi:hypothetical protein